MSAIVVKEKRPEATRSYPKPRNWAVILLNDDFTPTDFVTQLLITHFNKSVTEALTITDIVHQKGKAVAGIYPYEVAESKLSMVALTSRQARLPLRAIIEPS